MYTDGFIKKAGFPCHRGDIVLFPDAKPSLDFRNHPELLVAVMLSAQTTDAAVNKATPSLFLAYPTPEAMAASEARHQAHFAFRAFIEIRQGFKLFYTEGNGNELDYTSEIIQGRHSHLSLTFEKRWSRLLSSQRV